MKKLFTAFAFFLVTISFAQSTAYHSDKKLSKTTVAGKWFNSGAKQDMLIMVPVNTVSYAKVYREVKKALDDPGVKQQLEAQGATVMGSSPADTQAFHRSEMAKFKRAVEISGAKAE